MDLWTIVLVLLAIVLGFKVITSFLQPKFVPEPVAKFQVGELTLQALRYYCGYDYMRPTLIAIRGNILDVTGSYDQYGPGDCGQTNLQLAMLKNGPAYCPG